MSETQKPARPQTELVINTDGGSRGNPGPSAIGVVITTPDGNSVESFGEYLGVTTNNQAEYTAVLRGLAAAQKYRPRRIKFILDSELVVKQLKGEYRVKNPELQPLFAEIIQRTRGLDASFSHVLRAQNRLADREVNKALDAHAKS